MARHSNKQTSENGFTLMVVLLALVVMSTLAVAALLTADDEHKASSAMRESSAAFYVAEAGLNEVFANWSSHQAAVDSLAAGDSLELGWTSLSNGNTYYAVIHRWDMGDRPLYELVVKGRSSGALGGQRTLSYLLTAGSGGDGDGYTLGECCDAAMIIRGELDWSSRAPVGGWRGEIDLSGIDTHPPDWDSAGVCSESTYDKPAVIMEDSSMVRDNYPTISSDCDAHPGNVCPVTVEGDPQGIVEDPTITSSAWDQFGDLSWDSLKALADHTLGVWGTQIKLNATDIHPRYTVDVSTGEVVCDTSSPYNWGSKDPLDPCFNYFPIILLRGEVEFSNGFLPDRVYGQGLMVLDWNSSTSSGTEFEIGRQSELNGIILGKGCMEVQKGAQFHGSMYVDHTYDGPSCDAGGAFIDCRGHDSTSGGMCDNTTVQWSQCAVDRVLKNNSKLGEFVEISNPASGGVQRLVERAFREGY
ncbi:MAG TPA: hypothetical protein VLC48_05985 [Gemmatimonadota bacterium]|nr:hypothetical protein [Gemmatimonadota bacterium]